MKLKKQEEKRLVLDKEKEMIIQKRELIRKKLEKQSKVEHY